MPVIAKNEGKRFEKPPVGVVQAVCAFVEDIGTHQSEYNGKPTLKHQIVICWELAEKMKEGDNAGKPFMLPKFYTLSLNEKANLRKDLESWRGQAFTEQELEGFDIERLIGVNCYLNLVAAKKGDGSDMVKIAAIMPLARGMELIKPVNKIPPAWIEEKRAQSIEMSGSDTATTTTAYPQNELPF